MTTLDARSRPSDWLLAWLSARGRASLPTVDRACRAIADRVDSSASGDRSPIHRYVGPLRRIGHVEAVEGGLAVVPTTLCWTRRADRGVFMGARDESLLDDLHRRLGSTFLISNTAPPWPVTWGVAGDRGSVEVTVAELDIAAIDEPGMRLLASLPTLEATISAWTDSGPPSALCRWEVVVDPERRPWNSADAVWVEQHGLIRLTGGRRRGWIIVRDRIGRPLDSPEKRAVAWWAELARLGRSRLVYDREAERLSLPASLLPPPIMVERPLIWASGSPPRRDSSRGYVYEAIDAERADEVARILGLTLENAS